MYYPEGAVEEKLRANAILVFLVVYMFKELTVNYF